ncbi:YggT family protein [Streptococcus respiraculi]|uniref:YggT family protein n=1 Tax=Streptococcus respiraculi TaxID=2021971 RepID=UPI000E71C481|nr:YggT family protein [Streptococcus respiraculi]
MAFVIFILLRALKIYSYVLVAYALLSWIPSAYDSSIGRFITSLVRPVLEPFRRLKLQFFGLDFTIFLLYFLIQLLSRILINLL